MAHVAVTVMLLLSILSCAMAVRAVVSVVVVYSAVDVGALVLGNVTVIDVAAVNVACTGAEG